MSLIVRIEPTEIPVAFVTLRSPPGAGCVEPPSDGSRDGPTHSLVETQRIDGSTLLLEANETALAVATCFSCE